MSGGEAGPPQDVAALPPADPDDSPDEAVEGPPSAPPARRRRIHPLVELVVILAIAFGLAYVIQGYVVRPYKIPSASMEPTLEVGDMVLVNRFIYHFENPARGDIIVFHPPGAGQQAERGATTEAAVTFIKRVIGLPGETVQIVHGTVLICAHPHVGCRTLHESYLSKPADTGSYGPYVVPAGDYFVMGDNRVDSLDSRFWGPVPRRNIIGEAFMIYWPIPRIGFL